MTTRPPYSHSPFAQAAPFGGDPYVSTGSRLSRIGYGFAWTLLVAAGAAGLAFSLYRNDVLLNAARRGGWEPRYLAFEARMLGRPGWGTPRSLSTELQSATPEPGVGVAAALLPAAVREPVPAQAPAVAARDTAQGEQASAAVAAPIAVPAAQPAAAEPAAASASAVRATAEGVKIVSLDALAALPVAAPRAAPAPARRASDSTPPARAVPERPAPATPAKAPVAKAPIAKAPAPAPARPAPAPANENPLKAAIRNSIAKESQAK